MGFEKCYSILMNNALPLRSFLSYNDPFECLPEFIAYNTIMSLYLPTKDDKKYVIYTHLLQFAVKYSLSSKFVDGIVQGLDKAGVLNYPHIPLTAAYVVVADINAIYNDLKNEESDVIACNFELFYQKYYEQLSKYYTSCFTGDMNNILMWSHYADSHNGVVVEFDPEKGVPFTTGILIPMKYQPTSRFNFTTKGLTDNNFVDESVQSLISTKSNDWKYEHEIRLLYNITNKSDIIWYDKFANPCIKISPATIKSVYIGRRASQKKIDRLKAILEERGLGKQVRVVSVKLSQRGYSIEV